MGGKQGTSKVLERILLFRIRVAHWFSLLCCLAFSKLRTGDGEAQDLGSLSIQPLYPTGSPRRMFNCDAASSKAVNASPWYVLHAPTDEEVDILSHCGDQVNMVA